MNMKIVDRSNIDQTAYSSHTIVRWKISNYEHINVWELCAKDIIRQWCAYFRTDKTYVYLKKYYRFSIKVWFKWKYYCIDLELRVVRICFF